MPDEIPTPDTDKLLDRQQAFGYTQEDLRMLLAPMATAGRGADRLDGQRHAAGGAVRTVAAAAVRLLQAALRAGHQPADRPDPRGARDVAWRRSIGGEPNLLSPGTRRARDALSSPQPILTNEELEKLRRAARVHQRPLPQRGPLDALPGGAGRRGVEPALASCARTPRTRSQGRQHPHPERSRLTASAWPSRPCSRRAAVHHHLMREGTRTHVRPRGRDRRGARGASLRPARRLRRGAINPYLAFETLLDIRDVLRAEGRRQGDGQAATSRRSTRACSR